MRKWDTQAISNEMRFCISYIRYKNNIFHTANITQWTQCNPFAYSAVWLGKNFTEQVVQMLDNSLMTWWQHAGDCFTFYLWCVFTRGPVYKHGLTLIPARINNHIPSMVWNCLSISKLQRLYRWSLGMEKYFHATLYIGCNYLSMLALKLNHVSKLGYRSIKCGEIEEAGQETAIFAVPGNKLCIFFEIGVV